MKRKWIKGIIWVLISPVLLFLLVMILLYIPPVQNLLRKEVTAYASKATGMEISIRRIDLRFPLNLLITDAQVIQPALLSKNSHLRQQPDTLLTMESLNVKVEALPLFKGKVEIDNITLKNVYANSAELIKGIYLKGKLGSFFLSSHGIDLTKEEVVVNRVELKDTHLQVVLADTSTTPKDTTKVMLNWNVKLQSLKLDNSSIDLRLPLDSIHLFAQVGAFRAREATANLKHQWYGCEGLTLAGSSLSYDRGSLKRTSGLDVSHIALHRISCEIDSTFVHGEKMNGVIKQLSLYERSGLSVTSLTGRFFADAKTIRIPQLQLLTPYSDLAFEGQSERSGSTVSGNSHLSGRFDARIGKQDVLLLVGDTSGVLKAAYPFRPLVIHVAAGGTLDRLLVTRLDADLPGAFSMTGKGSFSNLTDSVKRRGNLNMGLQTQDLNFLTDFADKTVAGSLAIPDSMKLSAQFGMEGSLYNAVLHLQEGEGLADLKADYDAIKENYHVDLDIIDLQLHHFLPKDSIYGLTARLEAQGSGLDLTSRRTSASVKASVGKVRYGKWKVSNIALNGGLKNSLATFQLTSNNVLLKMQAGGEIRLWNNYQEGQLSMDVEQLNLYELGLSPKELKHPFAFNLKTEMYRDSIHLAVNAGDLTAGFRTRSTVQRFLKQSDEFATVLVKQLKKKHLDHAALRKVLPSAGMRLTAGRQNPLIDYLATRNMSFDDLSLNFGLTPRRGINGRTSIHGLRIDSLRLDTIFLAIRQDTSRMTLQAGVINGPKNPQYVFRGTMTGEIRNDDAEMNLNYTDGHGDTGLQLGINARVLSGGHGKGDGILFRLTPAEPIIAFRKFHFVDNNNWVYLHKNMRVYAEVDMLDKEGMGFRMHSVREDSVSLQNMNIELNRIRLNEISNMLPYVPSFSGLFSADAHYIQTPTSLQISTEANVQNLTYEREKVGNVGFGVTWLPGERGKHYLNAYFTNEGNEVLSADATLRSIGGRDSIQLDGRLEHFPLSLANSFIPYRVVSFTGDVDGEIFASGVMRDPKIKGNLSLDSVSIYSRQAGARYWFDNRPVQIKNNQLLFDKFAIYTTSKNPFTIDGNVDFRNLQKPTAQLNLFAKNYTLLDAPRTRESLVYGKAYVDLRAVVRGPLDALTMRGDMNLLGNTNVTYVLTDSPFAVEDRLEGLVTFKSFGDTAEVVEQVPTMSLGGMDMLMSLHIDDAVRLRADLSPDRSKYVELEGGGDLAVHYTPRGTLDLTGRYTLSGGVMKYALPIIPLKEFSFINGSYVDWTGKAMNPSLNLKATERVRASVSDDDGVSRMVSFDVSISIKNKLDSPELIFDLDAPDDPTIASELLAMGQEERSKQAIAMLATGIYLNNRGKSNLNMGTALNSVLQSQINALAGAAIRSGSLSVGVEDHQSSETGSRRTDYSFRYSQRFFNDRVQIIIGGKVSTGTNATNDVESFIDNISLEYRLDKSGTRYIRVFHDKNYESVLDGEITETGVGIVFRRKMDHLGELFFLKRKKTTQEPEEKQVKGK